MSKELLQKIKSVKLCLMAHPDNTENSEFADRISDLEEIENELSKKNEISSSLPFYDGFVKGKGYCDGECKAVVWEKDRCIYRKECPIGKGTVWVLPKNDR